MVHPSFPTTRLRRNRSYPWLRRMVAETTLSVDDLIWPVFVQEGTSLATPIASMPGVYRYSVDRLVEEAKKAYAAGIPALAVFPVTPLPKKTEDAREAYNPDNLMCRAVAALKNAVPEMGVICDVALDPYTTHGHDGVLETRSEDRGAIGKAGEAYDSRLTRHDSIANDATIEILCKQALSQARAGCDIIAPSDMMDGRIGKIRSSLDADGFEHVAILSYAAKYASAFYGPFRTAVGSEANLGKAGKQTYQMNPANAREALREVALDVAEGADMVMVKPGLPYLDILSALVREFPVPVLAYQVSGEYAMLKAAHAAGYLDFETTMLESLLALKRAGASAIFTYAALEIAEKL